MRAPDLLTTAQVAELHGVTPRRVLGIASDRDIVPALDLPRHKMWTRAQARALKPGAPGRPPKSTTEQS